MRRLILTLALLSMPLTARAQAWNTFLDQSRATTWQGTAGFAIPAYTVACPTPVSLSTGSGAASANGASINAALASCNSTHNVVNIPAGTWYTTGITAQTGTSVLRGAGPNSTTLIITTSDGCGGLHAGICLSSTDATYGGDAQVLPPSGNRQCQWTAGYAQGTTTITLNSCPSPPTSGRTLVLDQANDTSDTGGVYVCSNGIPATCNAEGPGSAVGRQIPPITGTLHTQTQVTHMTVLSGSGTGPYSVAINPGVYFNNISSGKNPGAWWNGNVKNMGVENLTIDRTGFFLGDSNIAFNNCDQCWVKNVRSEWAGRNHVWVYLSSNAVIRDSYFYQNQSHAAESYGIEQTQSSGTLIENNITQQLSVPTMFGPGSGSVVDYNLFIDNAYPAPNMALANAAHSAGNAFNLWEGNIANGINSDDSWGGSDTGTWFRNFLVGWQPGYTQYTYPISIEANNRAFNLVGNVLGQPSYQTTYESYASSNSAGVNGGDGALTSIYTLGWTGFSGWGGCVMSGSSTACDPLVRSTLMRWGNWDIVTNAAKFDSTEASPGAVASVNANFSPSYFTGLAHTLPASLYYSSTPSWWPGGKAWPAIGPDVSGGNVGICTGSFAGSQATTAGQCTGGTKSTAWASHVTSIPAQDCFLTTMSGPPDGSGSVLAFDAATCYGTASTYTLSTATAGTGSGTVSCSPSGSGIFAGTPYSCTVTPAAGSSISSVAGCGGSGTTTYSGPMPASNCTVTATFQGTVAIPTFSPAAGSYGPAQTVTISSATSGASIYYTTNGSTPTTGSTLYTAPISVSTTTLLKAIAVKASWTDSAVASGTFTINGTVATPTFTPVAGTYTGTQSVAILDATPGSTIYYTTDGSTPTTSSTPYAGPISVVVTTTIKAIAVAGGFTNSPVATALYTITAATPTFSPAPGSYGPAQTVTISDATPSSTIYYTTDGSTPTTGSTVYSTPISVSVNTTIKAIAAAAGHGNSAVGTAVYVINGAAATPTYSPVAGTYTFAQTVTISDSTPSSTIYYTTDGSTPTTSSTVYSGPILIATTTTLKSIAAASGFTNSAVASGVFTITTTPAAIVFGGKATLKGTITFK